MESTFLDAHVVGELEEQRVMKAFKRRVRAFSPVVFCGPGNQVCDRQAVARAIRDQAKAAASAGHLARR